MWKIYILLILANLILLTRAYRAGLSCTHTHSHTTRRTLTLCLISLEFVFSRFIRPSFLDSTLTATRVETALTVPVDLSSSTVACASLYVLKKCTTSCPKLNRTKQKEENDDCMLLLLVVACIGISNQYHMNFNYPGCVSVCVPVPNEHARRWMVSLVSSLAD